MTKEFLEPKCMFCWAHGRETVFDDEHMIPENIGGTWAINDCVCRECNNTLGSEVDIHAWRLADVVTAHERLGIPFDANAVFKKHYKCRATMGGRVVPFKSEWTASGIRLKPYPYTRPDGGMVYPLGDYKDHLDRHLARSGAYSKSEVADLFRRIDESRPGERVPLSSQGKYFIKGDPQRITLDISAKENQIGRLIAKIAYEFLYTLTAPLLSEWSAVSEPLRQFSRYGTVHESIHIRRVKANRSEFESFHSVRCDLRHGIIFVYVTLFGAIVYELFMNVAPDDSFLQRLRIATNCPVLLGFDYEQEILKSSRGLRAILTEDRFETIHVW